MNAAHILSAEERAEILELAGHYQEKRAACIEALVAAQRGRGWISDQLLAEIAALLDMTPAEIDNVATFYNLIFRKPVGRHVILLCDSVSCWIMGCTSLAAQLKHRLGIEAGETSADGRFTLVPIACLGTCDRAPALIIDRDTHTDLTPEKLDEILAQYP